MDVSVVPPGEGGDKNWSVVLKLSSSDILPPEINSILGKTYSRSASSSSIEIVFSFNEEEGVVYASVKDEDDGLLDCLFMGDDGLVNPNMSLSLLKQDEAEMENDDESNVGEDQADKNAVNGKNGKPYYWCQVLSGLNFPPPTSSTNIYGSAEESESGKDAPFQIQACTKAVFRQLLRRIRARKTLAAILEFLGKRSQMLPLPIHPAMKGEDGINQPQSPKAKLHSWTEEKKSSASSSKRRYIATIKRKSSTLKATVVIDMQNYPAEPPVWSLQNEDGSSGTPASWGEEHGSISSLQQNSSANNNSNVPPLFDANLHRIECHVNQHLDKFVRQDMETTYDWILIHQLADIISCWDEVMNANEGGGGSSVGGRLRKGKDRRLLGFGERSPFFWYRNGL